ncbi:Protein SSH4 [Trichoderma simmonsii]|uniref:Protein SSH4 n=1 Tax=Trichoderma simmonsii TaxID=1491479 RepID=A0A8G0L8B1_9HYPO|nr:Protein SSH4 [Trichoderma simmonsii]
MLQTTVTQSTISSVQKLLHNMPRTLNESYEQSFATLPQDGWLQSALRWIVLAVRPLSKQELAVAVALDESNGQPFELLKDYISVNIIADLLRVAGSLIKIIDNQVFPFHRTLRDYLSLSNILRGGCHGTQNLGCDKHADDDPHLKILTQCLDYVRNVERSSLESKIEPAYIYASEEAHPGALEAAGIVTQLAQQTAQGSPQGPTVFDTQQSFLNYACLYWPEHYKLLKGESKEVASQKVFQFLEEARRVTFWAREYTRSARSLLTQDVNLDTRLKIVCYFGLVDLLQSSFDSVKSDEVNSDEIRCALGLAAGQGHLEVVKFFTDNKITHDEALGLAAANGFDNVMSLLATKLSIEQTNKVGYTPLHQAACRGHQKVVHFLLSEQADLEKKTPQGLTALHVACQTGQTSIVQMLINNKANLTAEDKEGYDGLKLAAQAGFSEIVHELLNKGVDPRKPSKDGDTALHLAAKFGHPNTVDFLLEKLPDAVDRNKSKYSPLHLAAEAGYLNIVKKLLLNRKLYDIPEMTHVSDDESDSLETTFVFKLDDARTPLQLAAKNGHLYVVEELLRGLQNSPCNCAIALFLAATNGRSEVVLQLLGYGIPKIAVDTDRNTGLHNAAKAGHVHVVSFLSGVPDFIVDPKNGRDWTPLHMASASGNLETVEELLNLKANVKYVTDTNETPLQLAAAAGHRLTTRKLIRELHDTPKLRDEQGRIAFSLAAEHGHTAVAEELILAGVRLESPLHDGRLVAKCEILRILLRHEQWRCEEPAKGSLHTPLHLAVISNSLESVKLLLSASVDLNARDSDKKTPLFLAAEKGYGDIADTLILAGAELNADDKEGRTPLYVASFFGHLSIVQVLLGSKDPIRQVDVEKRASRGWTPLHAAHDNSQITKLLLRANATVDCRTQNTKSTPLSMAVIKYYSVAAILLQHKADPNVTDTDGETSVHRAVLCKKALRMVKLLASYGAKLDVQRKDKSTPLHLAANNGDLPLVDYLLKEGAVAENVSEMFGTALTAAAEGGNIAVAKRILTEGIDVNATGGAYHTALQAAAHNGRAAMVDLLLEKQANVNLRHGSNRTALEAAIEQGYWRIALNLLDHRAEFNATETEGTSPLQMAIRSSLGLIVQRLINDGADVNCDGSIEESPLCLAVVSEDESMFKMILEAKPNLRTKFKDGSSPLSCAVKRNKSSMVQALLDAGVRDQRALEDAVSIGNISIVDMFLKVLEKPISEIHIAGSRSLVHLSIEKGQVEVLRALVERGADLSVKDKYGRAVLAYAIYLGRDSIINYLLKLHDVDNNVIDVNDIDQYGLTPLGWAVIKQSACVRELIKKGGDVNHLDREGKTPLIYACITDQKETVQILIQGKADASVRDHRGRGALYWASRQASVEVFNSIRDILTKNDQYNERCAGALCAAIASRRNYFVDKLLQENPTIWKIPAGEGWTPIYTAKQYGNDDLVLRMRREGEEEGGEEEEISPKPDNYPTRWSDLDRSLELRLEEAGTVITVVGQPNNNIRTFAAVRADFAMVPIPELQNVYYFEVTIEKSGGPGSWGIGFTEEHTDLNTMLGWPESSWGYHGDDGDSFAEGLSRNYGPIYGEGAVIGCGINFDKNIAFYTKNGKILGQAFTDIRGKLYPAISVDKRMVGSRARTNFWKSNGPEFNYTGSLIALQTFTQSNSPYETLVREPNADGLEMELELKELSQENDAVIVNVSL